MNSQYSVFFDFDEWDDEFYEFYERIEEQRLNRVPKRYIRDGQNPFEWLSEEGFRRRFRFRKETVLQVIIPIIFPRTSECSSQRGLPLTPAIQVLVALRFYATSSFQAVCGDLFSISQPTVHRVIKNISEKLCLKIGQYIRMPQTAAELDQTRSAFYRKWRFPGVTGLVDGTHIPIISPGGENAEVFRNRKGYFSINTQIVCGPNEEIFDLACRWPGSAHDSRVFDSSAIRVRLEENPSLGHFLGDSGYAQKSYIFTPIPNPMTDPQRRYNRAHIQTRSMVERTIGRLKRRFPCLYFELQTKLRNTLRIIPACAILYNIGLRVHDLWDDEAEDPLQIVEVPNHTVNDADNTTGNGIRNAFIARYFNN